jgi:16S rRNA (guanine1516-N2)-methyltransferase
VRYVVSTSRRGTAELNLVARQWAERLGVAFASRGERSLARLCADEAADAALTVTHQRVSLVMPGEHLEYFFHPGMARTRIRTLRDGRGDPMVAAMELAPGDEVLDCTLGRASDAIVASWVVGEHGRVVGIEVQPLVAELTIHGLSTYEIQGAGLVEAMRRIDARRGDYEQLLPSLPDGAFDVVYFDPFFDEPVEQSQAMAPLRRIGEHRQLAEPALAHARRLARRCVVIKQRRDGPLRALQALDRIEGGAGSRIEYLVIRPGR